MSRGPEGVRAVPWASGGVSGSVRVPPSKSLTQRALVAAALAGNGATVRSPLDAEDPRLLFEALRGAGFRLVWDGETVRAGGRDDVDRAAFELGNNGTGMRFLLAQLATLPGAWVVDGAPRLRERPVAPLIDALRRLGAEIEPMHGRSPSLPLSVAGRRLSGGEVAVDAAASSQFVSALLLLGAVLPDGLSVRLPAPPPSRPYLDLTAEVLEAFGARVTEDAGGTVFAVRGGGLAPATFAVEGDWSAAAFPLAAAAVAGGELELSGLSPGSRQGDAAVLGVLTAAGCRVRTTPGGLAFRGPAARPLDADLADTPDLFPALAVVTAAVGGRLEGLHGLAGKESDRLAVMTGHLAEMGFAVEAGDGWFAARGGPPRSPASLAPFDPAADHRIAMALAVAGCVVAGVRVRDPGCVAKSWPGFWSAWDGLFAGRR
jgi:3-phosphoshikimate 1-carboxyvinyltransferase